jgi:hypothetical protein
MSRHEVISPDVPRALPIDFTDDLQMVRQQGDGRPLWANRARSCCLRRPVRLLMRTGPSRPR